MNNYAQNLRKATDTSITDILGLIREKINYIDHLELTYRKALLFDSKGDFDSISAKQAQLSDQTAHIKGILNSTMESLIKEQRSLPAYFEKASWAD